MNYETKIEERTTVEADGTTTYSAAVERQGRPAWVKIVAIALIAATLLGAWYMFNHSKSGNKTATQGTASAGDAAKDVPTVSVAVPTRQTIEHKIYASGTLGARREVPIGVVGEGGRVIDVRTDAGGWVSQGQVLVVVERSVQNEQVRGIEAQIVAAQSQARLAQAELDRATALIARGFISKADVDRKRAARDNANAQVNVARAQLSELRARNARLDIRAPASGYILSRNVEIGQVISAGSQPLFTMARGGEIELNAQLNEADLANVSVGTRAAVTPVGTTQQFKGQIWQIAPIIDPQTRQGIARISLPFDRGLRPGGFANAEIVAGSVQAPLLPESAVLNDDDGAYVFIVNAQNKIERRSVTTGTVSNDGIAIISGLNGTEQVVLRAGGFVSVGDVVKPNRVVMQNVGTVTDAAPAPAASEGTAAPAPAPTTPAAKK